MGEHNVIDKFDATEEQAFIKALLEDIRALAFMLESGCIESGKRRVGAEQELFLVDRDLQPAPLNLEVLQAANESRLTTEIARFNLEANLTPQLLTRDCFGKLEQELTEVLSIARHAASSCDANILLAGILPTLEKSDLHLANLTPISRYRELNHGVIELRGGPLSIHIKGVDELHLTHDNIMMESCNASFQVHFQADPKKFTNQYNIAQAITAPTLAAAVNSPILFGHRLWHETRVALFQHSTDERSSAQQRRSQQTRVSFGDRWLEHSVIELFQEQVSRFRPIMITKPGENPFRVLARGETPDLSALKLHNGTVWRWNRACYGVLDGVAHLRIENRALPAGPTIVDEIANAAFFTGLMIGLGNICEDISARMNFHDAKSNFFRAARYGLDAQFDWLDGEGLSAASLILDQLLPLAHDGLHDAGVDNVEIEKYLGIIEARTAKRQTGSRWILNTLQQMPETTPRYLQCKQLTAAIMDHQQTGQPVHDWPIAKHDDSFDWDLAYRTVAQIMSTDLFTVRPDDLIDLAASGMNWRHIRHVPVEDKSGRLVGLITHRTILRLMCLGAKEIPTTVAEVMVKNPVTVSPSTTSLEAIEIMRANKVGCLPVVEDNQLVGIVTSYDFLTAAANLFKRS